MFSTLAVTWTDHRFQNDELTHKGASTTKETFSYILNIKVGKTTDSRKFLMTGVESKKEFVEKHESITKPCFWSILFYIMFSFNNSLSYALGGGLRFTFYNRKTELLQVMRWDLDYQFRQFAKYENWKFLLLQFFLSFCFVVGFSWSLGGTTKEVCCYYFNLSSCECGPWRAMLAMLKETCIE